MAHVDGGKNTVNDLTTFIKNNFNDLEKIHAVVLPGPWCNSCDSLNIINSSLNNLNIKYKIYENNINWESSIMFDKIISIN